MGEQYASKQNTIQKDDKQIPLPIITIYFLVYGLDNNRHIPIIRIKREYIDNHNGDKLAGEELFIETLTHDSIIVQIPALKTQRRDDLEKALSVFETEKVQEVSINEADYPERYQPVIRQLLKAIADEQVRKTMDVEDEILEDLDRKERLIAKKNEHIEKQAKRLEEKDNLIEKLQQELDRLKNK